MSIFSIPTTGPLKELTKCHYAPKEILDKKPGDVIELYSRNDKSKKLGIPGIIMDQYYKDEMSFFIYIFYKNEIKTAFYDWNTGKFLCYCY